MRILGIDPGAHGALALYQPLRGEASGLRWHIRDLPKDMAEFRDLVQRFDPSVCYLEEPFHVKASSYASMELGRNVGRIEGVLLCMGIKPVPVAPITWKAHFKLLKSGKDRSLTIARLLVDESNRMLLQRKLDHNRAEAILIAAYGAHHHGTLL